MKLMHTKLPDFLKKAVAAGKKINQTQVTIEGFESMKSAKLASLRVGRIEDEIVELTSQNPKIKRIEIQMIPRVAETINTVIIKGIKEEDGAALRLSWIPCSLRCLARCILKASAEVSDRRAPLD